MPISRKYKAAFVHVPKTGGQTIAKILGTETVDDYFGVHEDVELSHLTASQLRQQFPQFDEYYSFAFVRNPWSRVVSEYFYRANSSFFLYLPETEISFKDYISQISRLDYYSLPQPTGNHLYPQYDFLYGGSGKLLVNRVCRFENFTADLTKVMKDLGIDTPIPHINSTKHLRYGAYYDRKTRDMVFQMYRKDIETFGYRFFSR